MDEGDNISIRVIFTTGSEMVDLHKKCHQKDQFHDRFLIC